MSTLHVDVVSAEQSLYSGEAAMVVLPGESGELGIYPRHTPLITRIRPGLMQIKKTDGTTESIFVAGGILEIQPNVVTVLADTAQRSDELDEAKANEARQRAIEAKANAKNKEELAVVEAELAMLAAQIASIRKLRGK